MKLIGGDCLEVLKTLQSDSIDSIVTDPPYGISFMNKHWDYQIPSVEVWRECLRVLKPGGHALIACGTRTQHRMAVNIEDAGFEIRDVITWLYGSGFPKSLNVHKQLCNPYACQLLKNVKLVGPESQPFPVELNGEKIGFAVVNAQILLADGSSKQMVTGVVADSSDPTDISLFVTTEPTDLNTTLLWKQRLAEKFIETKTCTTVTELETITGLKIWNCLQSQNTLNTMLKSEGVGTALKPACEFWTLARKPLGESTVAKNVLKHGVGGINVDGCRVGFANDADERESKTKNQHANFESGPMTNNVFGDFTKPRDNYNPPGRFPANLILDEEAGALLDAQSGELKSGGFTDGTLQKARDPKSKGAEAERVRAARPGSAGGASRFFYTAKASKSERNAGCEGLEEESVLFNNTGLKNNGDGTPRPQTQTQNFHPTVKPIKLMRYLCRLITPPGGIVLDPFMGSGSTGVAAKEEGFDFLGVELMPEYLEIAKKRVKG